MLLDAPVLAEVKDPIYLPTLVVAPIKTKYFTVAKADGMSIGTATVDAWMVAGSAALQQDNSYPPFMDWQCPLRLMKEGDGFSIFASTFSSLQTNQDLKNLAESSGAQIKIVQELLTCGRHFDPVGLNGCSTPRDFGPPQVVLADNPEFDSLTPAHEVGHFQGIDYDYQATAFSGWIMYWKGVAGRGVVSARECGYFLR